MMASIEFWRTVGIALATAGQVLFTLIYLTWRWRETFLGKALFFKACAFSVVLAVAFLSRVSDFPHEDEIFVAMYYLLALGVWVQFIAFLRVRRSRTTKVREALQEEEGATSR